MAGWRGAVIALVVAMLATAACTVKGKGSTAGPTPSVTGSSVGPSPRPMAWRVAESVRLTPTSVLNSVVAVDATHAWAVGGERGQPYRPGVPVVERWDGHKWSRETLPDRLPPGFLQLVAADSPTNVWAVGVYSTSEDNIYWMLHFDGTAWRQVPFPLSKRSDNAPVNGITEITGLAVVGGHAWLVGHQSIKVVIQEWDGQSWRAHKPPPQCEQGGTSFGGMPNFCNLSW